MGSMLRGSLPVVALCFAMSIAVTSHGDTTGGATIRHFQPITTNTEQSPVPPATLIPLHQEPASSVAATAMAANTQSQLPQLQTAHNDGTGIGTRLQQQLLSKGRQLLTPQSLVNSMKQGEGIDIQDTAFAMGTQLSQDVINTGLRQMESSMKSHIFRTINLSWSPGLNHREDTYQLDSMMSLFDGDTVSFMSQAGVQSRDGEPAANVGLILRGRPVADWILGINTFYDYLSDPDIDRWSIGAEAHTSWFSITSNVYTGLSDDTVQVRGQRQIMYSPDGWDIEVAGRSPQLPWLEYSGRYYHWDREGTSKDLTGQDYRLTLKPMQLLDLSLRYDSSNGNERGGRKGEFGLEAQLKYQIGISMNEQTSYDNVAVPQDAWQRRFERVRREYEQMAQIRGTSATQCTTGAQQPCTITLPISPPANTGHVDGTLTAPTRRGAASSSSNSLLRASGTGMNCTITDDDMLREIADLACGYQDNSFTITITFRATGTFNYNLNLSFKDSDGGTQLGTTTLPVAVNVRGPEASQSGSTVCTGGICDTTLRVSGAPADTTQVEVTVTGRTVITMGTAISTALSSSSSLLRVSGNNCELHIDSTVTGIEASPISNCDYNQNTNEITVRIAQTAAGSYTYDLDIEFQDSGSNTLGITSTLLEVEVADARGVISSVPGTLTVNEGSSATYTLRLTSRPTGTVTITLTSSDTGAVTVTPTLSFDATDWSSTKTVTVTVVDDADATDEDVTITYGISGGGYDSVTLTAQSVTVTDNDMAEVSSTGGGNVTVTEGSDAAYTLVLTAQPTGTVTITLTSSDTGAVTVNSPLSFDASDWSNPKTVTVTGVEDADTVGESVTISYGISGGGYDAVTLAAQSVAVTDNDTAGVSSTGGGSVAVTEGGMNTYTLVLVTQPTGTVTITLTSSDTGAVTVNSPITFDATDWNTAKTVTVTGVDDADATDEDVTITYGISGGGYGAVTLVAQSVTVDDDETAGVTSSQSGVLSLTEGGSAGTYTLVLATEPTGTVTITLTSSDTGAVTVTPTLSFDATDWSSTKTVTVTVVDDADATDESVTITYGISGGGYDAVTLVAQSVTVDDDETAGVTSSQSGALSLTEGGAAGTYTLVLDTQPTGTVTITLTSDDTGAVTVNSPLTFDATDWNTMKTVTVTVVDDADATDEDVTITYGISGGGYDAVTLAAQSVTVDDDETAGVTSSQSGALALTEGGSAGTYTLVLDTEPTGTVTITLTSSDTGAVTVTPTLSFDATDWNTMKTVTVTVVDDADATDEDVTITYGISGGGYDSVTLAAQSVTVDDDETPTTAGVTSSQSGTLALTEGGSAGTYTLVLDTQPTGTVTITLTSSDTGAVTVNSPITFDATDWSNPKTVTVTVVDDADATDEDVTITYGISGGGYDGVTLTAQSVTVDDDETAGVTSSQSGALALTEGGSAGTYTLVLDTEPTGTVTITLTSSDVGAVTVTPTLTFDATDWNTMKTVTVTVVDDADATDEDVTITYGISGGGYDAVTLAAQSVTVDDDETAGVTSSQSGALALTEGGSAGTYTLVLDTEPTGTVTITLTSSDTGAVTVTPTLSFDATDWSSTKTVTVTVVDDADATDEDVTITYGISGGGYGAVTLAAQSVTVDDDETATTAGVTSSQSGALALTEGGSAGTYTLVLDTEPTGTVTITLTSSDTGAVTVTPTLSFDATDWSSTKTVTVTVVDDADATDESVTITYGISGGGYGAVTLAAQSVTVDDDETPTTAGVTSSQSGALALTEGGSAGTYTLVLDTEPTGTVTITLTSSDTGAVTVTPTLSFDATDWSSTKTVTVTVVDDADATDEDVTITYGISGGGYGAVTLAAQSVTVDDDETPTTAGVTSSQSGALALTEGGSAGTYTLVLDTEPTGTVTITLTSSDTGAVTVTPTLSFDATDWSSTKTVTVTVVDDADATDEDVTITYGISGGGYGAVTLTAQSVTVDDDETAGVTSSQSGALALTEGGSAGTYTLVLDTEPTGTVTITLTSSDTDAVTVTPTLSFDATDWNTMKTVTVTVVDDADATDEDVTITYGISGGGYGAVTLAAQSVAVTDNDLAGAGVTSTGVASISVTEGSDVTYTLVLDIEPTGTVTIALTSDDTTSVTVTPTLSFDATDWNTAKTVTVTGVDDADMLSETVSISYAISGGGYDLATLAAQSVAVTDDDAAGISSDGGVSVAVTEGSDATYTLVLTTQPTDDVVITLTSSDTAAATVTSTLTFTNSNWDTAQDVTVTGEEDDDTVDATVTISYMVASTDTDYDGFSLAAQSVAVTDNDTSLGLAMASRTITERTFGVDSAPAISQVDLVLELVGATLTSDLAVTLSTTTTGTGSGHATKGTDGTALTNSSTEDFSLVITSETINAGDSGITISDALDLKNDNIGEGDETFTLTLAVTNPSAFPNLVVDSPVTVTIEDDEVITLEVNNSDAFEGFRSGVPVNMRGGVLTVPLRLTISTSDGTAMASVGSTVGDYESLMNVPVVIPAGTSVIDPFLEITINGDTIDDDAETFTVTVTANTSDVASIMSSGANFTVANTVGTITITDDDDATTAGIILSGGAFPYFLGVTEGGMATYSLVLGSPPMDTVMVAITGSATPSVTVAGSPFTFTTANWNVRQMVTVSSAADSVTQDTDIDLSYELTSTGDSNYNGVTGTQEVRVVAASDPEVSLLPEVTVDDDNVVFTVQLDADNRPAAATDIVVTVRIGGIDGLEITDTTQTVTIEWDPATPGSSMKELSLARNHNIIAFNSEITATVQDDPMGNDYIVGSADSAMTATPLTDSRPTFRINEGGVTVAECEVSSATALGIMATITRFSTNMAAATVSISTMSDGANEADKSITERTNIDFDFPANEMTAEYCQHLKDGYPGGDMVTVTITASDAARVPSTADPTVNTASGTNARTVMVPPPPPGVSLSQTVAVDGDNVVFTVQLDADNRPAAATDIDVTVELSGAIRGVTGDTTMPTRTVIINWNPLTPTTSTKALSLDRNHTTIGLNATITATVQDDDPLGADYVVGSTPSATSATLTDSRPTFEVSGITMKECVDIFDPGFAVAAIAATVSRVGTHQPTGSILANISFMSGETDEADKSIVDMAANNFVFSHLETSIEFCRGLKAGYPGGDTVTVSITGSDMFRVPSTDNPDTVNMASGTHTDTYMVPVPPPEASITVTPHGGTAGTTVTLLESNSVHADRIATATFTLVPAPANGTMLDMSLTYASVGTAGALDDTGARDARTFGANQVSGGTMTVRGVSFTNGIGTTADFLLPTTDTMDDDGEGYTFTLVATDDYTIGDTGHIVTVNIEDDDVPAVAALTAAAGSAQVTLTWTNPTDAELDALIISATANGTAVDLTGGTSSISGLEVAVETSTDGNDLKVTAAPGGMLSGQAGNVTVTGLTDITEYTFSIVAVDEKGMLPDIRTYRSEPCCTPPVTATPTEALAPGVSLSPDVAVTGAAVGFTVQLDAANRPDIATDIEVTVQLTGAGVRGVGETDGAMETVTINWDPDIAGSDETVLSLSRNFSTIGVDGTITATVQDDDPLGADYVVGSTPSATTSEAIKDARSTFGIRD